MLIAQDRHGPPPGPAALRQARRGARLATGLRLPVICVIDTPGADLSARAEEDGLASQIAHCLADLTTLPVPTVSLLLGQGAGAAALALLPADRVLAAQHAWLAPLAPEGASAIVYRDTGHAPQLAARQGIGSADLAADGIVDQVIPETPADPGRFCRDLGHALHRHSRTWQTRATTHAWPGACTATATSGCHPTGGRYPRCMRVTFGHLRPLGNIMPDHAGDRGAVLLVLAPRDHLYIKQKRTFPGAMAVSVGGRDHHSARPGLAAVGRKTVEGNRPGVPKVWKAARGPLIRS